MDTTDLMTRPRDQRSRFRHDYRRFYTYTIYDKANDFPGKFVIRQWEVVTGVPPVAGIGFVCDTLFEARDLLPTSLFNVGHNPNDDPSILETWI